ncbi:hypothetical protein EZV62_026410 [Acer yangbiense]|uniref:Gnk2-homologous domain-containing protein n=1 Tax=Acer yangbiense TaxID=1000413 RepID=A0A5C7GSG5_9ROSI|nr:hypothetical protein EZV62_026410 [Acer yangbiense]
MAIVVVLSAPTTIHSLWLIPFLSFVMLQIFLADGLNRIGYSCNRTFNNNTASGTYSVNLGRLFTRKLYDEEECENTKSAITWFDECMVRYSDKPFSITFESVPAILMSHEDNFNASDPVEFRKALNQSFSHLIADAITSELKYATDIVNISSSVTLYTMGQCIPSLSKEDCRNCLNSAAQLVEHKKKGSRYLYPSCSARFELYQFWNSAAAQEPVSPVEAPPPVSDKSGGADLGRNRKENRAWIPITISLLAVVVVVLLGSMIWQIRRRNKRHKEEESNSQEVQLLRLREGRIGNDYSYDTLQGEKQMESQEFPFGYMAPEYAMEGLYSVKSDVFSFGVLLLEIISGRKNSGFYLSEHGLSLLNYTWKLWCEEQAPELMDPVLVQSCIQVELLKYIHIGLLCVQEDQTDRPSMSSVVAMLVSDNIRLPQPTQPAFSVGRAARQGQSLSDNFFSNEATRSQGQSSSDASDFSNEAARRVRFSSDVV